MPKDLSAYAPRAYAYAKQGEGARAIADAKVAVTLKPSQVPLERVTDLGLRGRAYRRLSQPELALRDFREAVRLRPNHETSYGNLGWFLATYPNDRFRNGTEAFSGGKNACKLSRWQNSGFIDVLAAAYAEAGDFDQAVKYEKQSLTHSSLAPKERQEREKRLALFQQGKPFRDQF